MPERQWVTTPELCQRLGCDRSLLLKLRKRGVLRPGREFRRFGCSSQRGPLQWHPEAVDAAIAGWSRRNLSV